MKRYKQILALLLTALITLALFAGCAKKEQTQAGTISEFDSQSHIQVGTSDKEVDMTPGDESNTTQDDESASGAPPREPLTGEFVVSDKKYDYRDENLVLLYVENQTNWHFSVTIHGTYLDENGETIKKETQTFEAFPAGWSNHFLFYPKVAFDSFTYELETKEYIPNQLTSDSEGNPLASYIGLTYEKRLYWQFGGNWIEDGADPDAPLVNMRDLCFAIELLNQHPSATISASFHVIVLDADGEIFLTDYEQNPLGDGEGINGTAAGPKGGADDGKSFVQLLKQRAGGDETIPGNVQGVFTAIFAMTDVRDMS